MGWEGSVASSGQPLYLHGEHYSFLCESKCVDECVSVWRRTNSPTNGLCIVQTDSNGSLNVLTVGGVHWMLAPHWDCENGKSSMMEMLCRYIIYNRFASRLEYVQSVVMSHNALRSSLSVSLWYYIRPSKYSRKKAYQCRNCWMNTSWTMACRSSSQCCTSCQWT